MGQVSTKLGLIDRDKLTVKEVFVGEDDNSRSIAMEWYLIETGELVRRDGWAVIFSGQAVFGAQQPLG